MKDWFYKFLKQTGDLFDSSHNMPNYGFCAGPACSLHPSDYGPGSALITPFITQPLPPAVERPAAACFWLLPALPSALIRIAGYIFFGKLNMKC